MRWLLLAVLVSTVGMQPARAEPLVVDLSESVVRITTGFTGTKVLLFGAVEGEGEGNLVVVVQGPRHSITVRRKNRVAGIWINRGQVNFVQAPSFYQVLSSATMDEWLPLRTRETYQIGVEYLKLKPSEEIGPAKQAEYRDALVRNMQREGRYGLLEGNVTVIGKQLFRADLYLPANLPTGYYTIEVLLVRDGDVKSIKSTPLLVTKSGIGAQISRFAYEYPALHGIAAIAIAVMAGLAGNAIFRKV